MSTNCNLTTQRNSRRISNICIKVQKCNSNFQQTIFVIPLNSLTLYSTEWTPQLLSPLYLYNFHSNKVLQHIFLNNITTHTQDIWKIQCNTLLYFLLHNDIPPPPNVEIISYNQSIWRLCNPGVIQNGRIIFRRLTAKGLEVFEPKTPQLSTWYSYAIQPGWIKCQKGQPKRDSRNKDVVITPTILVEMRCHNVQLN